MLLVMWSIMLTGALVGTVLLAKRENGLADFKLYLLLFLGMLLIVMILFTKNGSMTLCILLGCYSLIGMVLCGIYKRNFAYAGRLSAGLLILLLICMGIVMMLRLNLGQVAREIRREMAYSKAAGFKLGEIIAENNHGKSVLIIAGKDYRNDRNQREIIEGIKESINVKLPVAVDYPHIPEMGKLDGKDLPDMPVYNSEMLKAKYFNDLIASHKSCSILVFLINLPYDADKMTIWQLPENQRKQVYLVFSDIYNLKKAIKSGFVTAFAYRPKSFDIEEGVPESPEAAFKKRFLYINSDNVDNLDNSIKGLFRPEVTDSAKKTKPAFRNQNKQKPANKNPNNS